MSTRTVHVCKRCRVDVKEDLIAVSTCNHADCPLDHLRVEARKKAEADARPQQSPLASIWNGG